MGTGGLPLLGLALALDLLLGEPPRALHPVVALGKAIGALMGSAPRGGKTGPFLYGAAMTLGLTSLAGFLGGQAAARARRGGALAYALVGGLLLKSTFSLRELHRAARRVEASLAQGDLESARRELRDLVGRDISALTEPLAVSAAVESVAENLTDSFVAPVAYFWLFGLPGALAYRAVNTLDAMVGYHGPYEYLGKAAARLDDLLNYLPARLAAISLVAAAALSRASTDSPRPGQGGEAWRILRRDREKTESPNAGWTISAMAGALGVQLEKPGHYCLGDARRPLAPAKISEALRLFSHAVALSLLPYLLAEVVRLFRLRRGVSPPRPIGHHAF